MRGGDNSSRVKFANFAEYLAWSDGKGETMPNAGDSGQSQEDW
jgi:hypothetical protein